MKFTVKGVCFTLLVICSGFLLVILPSFVMGAVKNYLIARENSEVSRQEDHWIYNRSGRRFEYHDGSFIQNASQEINGVTYYFDEKGYVKTGWVRKKASFTIGILTEPRKRAGLKTKAANITWMKTALPRLAGRILTAKNIISLPPV